MSSGVYRFKQTDIARAVRAFERLGYPIRGCRITTDNAIEVLVAEGDRKPAPEPSAAMKAARSKNVAKATKASKARIANMKARSAAAAAAR